MLTVLSLLACGPNPPATLANGTLREAPVLTLSISLRDANDALTAAPGTVSVRVTESISRSERRATVCETTAAIGVEDFVDDHSSATRTVVFDPPCPPRAPFASRIAEFTFTPTGATPLNPTSQTLRADEHPSLAGPPDPRGTPPIAAPPKPSAPEEDALRLTPWPVGIRSPGATFAPDPNRTPAAPDAIEVTSPGCAKKIGLMSSPSYVTGGASIRARLAGDGAAFTVDDAANADRWALEYFVKERYGLNYGVRVGETVYLCRSGYVDAADRDCAAAVCKTLFADTR